MTTYKGYFKPKNNDKYRGTLPIIYRSSWELSLMIWCDTNKNITKWGSESIIIPYLCEIDKKYHKYYPDFFIILKNGDKYIIEIKPKNQTRPPIKNKSGRITNRYIKEVFEYNKNCSKWVAANTYAKENNYKFQVWTEETLKNLGIFII